MRRSPDDKDINKVIKFDLLTNLDGSVLDMDTRNKVTALIPIKPRKKQDKLDDVNRYELSRVPVHDPLVRIPLNL